MPIEIINSRNERPFRPYDFYVDRRSPLGNVFVMHSESDRDEVCDDYDVWFKDKVIVPDIAVVLYKMLQAYKKYGKLRLFCWCFPKRCHAETIKNFLEGIA